MGIGMEEIPWTALGLGCNPSVNHIRYFRDKTFRVQGHHSGLRLYENNYVLFSPNLCYFYYQSLKTLSHGKVFIQIKRNSQTK